MSEPDDQWIRRHRIAFPFKTRWYVVTMKRHATWRSVWTDLLYLIRG